MMYQVGLGTYVSDQLKKTIFYKCIYSYLFSIWTQVDPDCGTGGAVNEAAQRSSLQRELVTKLTVTFDPEKSNVHEYLLYKALPINVAIIRATTADSMGNLSLEHESLLCDQRIIAAAAKNSGGIVLAQGKHQTEAVLLNELCINDCIFTSDKIS